MCLSKLFKKKPRPKVWREVCNSFPDLPPIGARLANAYCPASHSAQYLKGQEPTAICFIHAEPEPVIPKCDIPYHQTGKLLIYVGFTLTELSMKDNALWKEADLPRYYDALTVDGVNAIRSFCEFWDADPTWDTWRMSEPEYFTHLKYRLGLIKERELTAILCLTPYRGYKTDDEIRTLIRETREFLPIYETENEPGQNVNQERIVRILREEGIAEKYIQLGYHDSGDFTAILESLNGKGLACCHEVGSLETVHGPHPIGWSGSDGTRKLMALGMYGSDDGGDKAGAAQGLYFLGAKPESRRPSPAQIYEVTKWMVQNGHGYEHLSAAAFQASKTPDLNQAIILGQVERRAMRTAYEAVA